MIQYKEINQSSFLVAGISVRTINKNGISQKDLAELWSQFMQDNVAANIPHKLSGDIYCVYTDYESDYTGYYTALIGCKVASAGNLPERLIAKEIPASGYHVYKAEGEIPESVGKIWMHIWQSDNIDRAYKADFDLYSINEQNPGQTVVSVYLSVK